MLIIQKEAEAEVLDGGSVNIFYITEFIEGILEAKGGYGGTGGLAGSASEGGSGGAGGAGTKTVTQLEI